MRELLEVSATPFDFIQYGVLGLVVTGFIFGWFWPRPAVDRLQKDKERAEEQRDVLIQVNQTQVIPVLAEANQRIAEIIPVLSDMKGQIVGLDSLADHLERVVARLDGIESGRQRARDRGQR